MTKWCRLLAVTFILTRCTVLGEAKDAECESTESAVRELSLSIHGEKNSSGDWVTFSAVKDTDNSTDKIDVDLKHTVTVCGSRHTIRIQGVVKATGNDAESHLDELLFYKKSGDNSAVINNGRTVIKLRMEEEMNGVAFTNRPLRDNELFEVKLEKKGSKFGHSMAIGVTTYSPKDNPIPVHMNNLKSGTWMLYGPHVYNNGTSIKGNFMKTIFSLRVGETVGVMRSRSGTLHFFVNGVDQGLASSNLPETLYGVFELYGDAGQATITDKPSF